MKIFITGGAGFIGSHLTDHYLNRGDEVIILDDCTTGSQENLAPHKENPRLSVHVGSVLNESMVRELVEESDMVYHMAAAVGVEYVMSHPLHTLQTNIKGTEVILEACRPLKRKIFIASTSEVYGKNPEIPFDEESDRVLGPTTIVRWGYSCSKALDEFLALAYHYERGLPVVIGRFFNTVGPRQTGRYGMVIPRFVQQALKNEPITIHGDGTQTRCYCDVSDTVRWITRLMEMDEAVGEVFNLGSEERISVIDLAKLIVAKTNSSSKYTYIDHNTARGEKFEDMHDRVPNIQKVVKATGIKPQLNLEQTVERIIDYYKTRR